MVSVCCSDWTVQLPMIPHSVSTAQNSIVMHVSAFHSKTTTALFTMLQFHRSYVDSDLTLVSRDVSS